MSYHRYVTKVEGNTITLDAPLFYTLDKTYSQAYIYKINNTTTIRHNIGIENLHISFERTPSSSKVNADQNCIYMSSLENSWVKGVSLTGFIHAGIKITSTTRTTIEDCYSIDPSGLCTGGTYYNFETYHRSQLILLKNCYGRNGRHHYLSCRHYSSLYPLLSSCQTRCPATKAGVLRKMPMQVPNGNSEPRYHLPWHNH